MSSKKGKTRILRAESILSELLTLGETFRIGLEFTEELVRNADLAKFGISSSFEEGKKLIPKPEGPRTRVNLKGLYVSVDSGDVDH